MSEHNILTNRNVRRNNNVFDDLQQSFSSRSVPERLIDDDVCNDDDDSSD